MSGTNKGLVLNDSQITSEIVQIARLLFPEIQTDEELLVVWRNCSLTAREQIQSPKHPRP